MALYHRAPSWYIVLVPVAIVLQAILLTGIGLALAPATVLIRDLPRVVRIALRVLFYLSPVIYSVRRLEIGPLRQLFQLNPMTGILDIFRSTAFPAEFIGWKASPSRPCSACARCSPARPSSAGSSAPS